jgi:Dolichyl-phosphate-mannose-protein mannosyltransferase
VPHIFGILKKLTGLDESLPHFPPMHENESEMIPTDNPQPRARVAAILALAALLRGLALWQFGGNLSLDPDSYREIARNLAHGRGFGFDPGQLNGSPTAYRPPLYPLLLAAITLGSSDHPEMFQWGLGCVQLALGVATVWLTILLGGRLRLGRWSLAAGLLVAIDPLLVYNTSLVMTETTATFLVVLLLWTASRGTTSGARLLSGALFGLCTLCRPTFWAFGLLCAAGWVIQTWRQPPPAPGTLPARRNWVHGLLLCAGAIFCVSPWVVRNMVAMGRPLLTTTHGGYTLLLAHNPVYTREVVDGPWGALLEGEAAVRWFEWLEFELRCQNPRLVGIEPSPAVEIARDRWMTRAAWQYIRDEPGTALHAGLTLLGRFWNIVPMNTAQRVLPFWLTWGMGAFYITTMALMLAGVFRNGGENRSAWWPLVALILSFTAVHALYWADMRMRAPLIPAIALLAIRGAARRRR